MQIMYNEYDDMEITEIEGDIADAINTALSNTEEEVDINITVTVTIEPI